jgi:hypothetical protein
MKPMIAPDHPCTGMLRHLMLNLDMPEERLNQFVGLSLANLEHVRRVVENDDQKDAMKDMLADVFTVVQAVGEFDKHDNVMTTTLLVGVISMLTNHAVAVAEYEEAQDGNE